MNNNKQNYLNPTPTNLAELVAQVQQLLQSNTVFFGHGTDNAIDEAAWLCLWVLELPLDTDLNENSNINLTAENLTKIEQILYQRIEQRQPTAYITNEAWLQGIPFYIDQRSIIPRSFIAELIVDGSIDPWLDPATSKVLDLCTGNGSLAVIAAMAYPEINVDAADISQQALEIAAINVAKHQLEQRINIVQSNIFSQLPDKYDLIICNPPYVNSQSMQSLPQEYLQEPQLALAGGDDGMDFIRTLFEQAAQHLTDNGVLVLEIGNEFDNFTKSFADLDTIWLKTNAGDEQVLLLTKQALDFSYQ